MQNCRSTPWLGSSDSYREELGKVYEKMRQHLSATDQILTHETALFLFITYLRLFLHLLIK